MTILSQEEVNEIKEMLSQLEVMIAIAEVAHQKEVKSLKHVISEHEAEIYGLLERLEEKEKENEILWKQVNNTK